MKRMDFDDHPLIIADAIDKRDALWKRSFFLLVDYHYSGLYSSNQLEDSPRQYTQNRKDAFFLQTQIELIFHSIYHLITVITSITIIKLV